MTTQIVTLAMLGLAGAATGHAPAQEPDAGAGPRALGERFDAAFNRGDAAALAALFDPMAELVDEQGNVYRGREAIAEALGGFFERFPDAKLAREVEELRLVGPSLAIEDGVTTITAADRATARNRYLAVLSGGDDGWRIASMRQVAEEAPPTARDQLEPIAWLVGDWVSEGSDQAVSLSFRWSEDGNFLLGGYTIEGEDEGEGESEGEGEGEAAGPLRTEQRIGWDAEHRVIRSWNFDSDGGFSEGRWSTDGSAWVVKSDLVLPEGVSGSATFYLAPVGADRFVWSSLDRVIGGVVQPNIEVTIVREPPAPQD